MSVSEKHFFQQYRAQSRTANVVLDAVSEHVDNRVLSDHFPEQFM
jgi:hypothetical protein